MKRLEPLHQVFNSHFSGSLNISYVREIPSNLFPLNFYTLMANQEFNFKYIAMKGAYSK